MYKIAVVINTRKHRITPFRLTNHGEIIVDDVDNCIVTTIDVKSKERMKSIEKNATGSYYLIYEDGKWLK